MTDFHETNHAAGNKIPFQGINTYLLISASKDSSLLEQKSITFFKALASYAPKLASGNKSFGPIKIDISKKVSFSGFWWKGHKITLDRPSEGGSTSILLMPGFAALGSSSGRNTESSFHVGSTYMMDVASGGINAAAGSSPFLGKHEGELA
ncbi:hypothetical protein CBI36_02850 [Acetobacter oryzifermentans]|uniref:Uncharacterized protein n=2 Tax=Acetobacter TaxID=434 RepID=A0AAN1PIZ9_9PROT|nr:MULTISPECIES: hypothetical protein [Acetobacter]ASL39492.1 hypothetical protein CBI36_02850 [Acetobacter oryzifermentans]AXC25893.1 hypothetical protein DS739_03240 [Acetobacter sp. JWB]AXN01080.1 hypothetical protein CJF59_11350 [Acetobacter pomorum]